MPSACARSRGLSPKPAEKDDGSAFLAWARLGLPSPGLMGELALGMQSRGDSVTSPSDSARASSNDLTRSRLELEMPLSDGNVRLGRLGAPVAGFDGAVGRVGERFAVYNEGGIAEWRCAALSNDGHAGRMGPVSSSSVS